MDNMLKPRVKNTSDQKQTEFKSHNMRLQVSFRLRYELKQKHGLMS